MPYVRQISLTGRPASASFRIDDNLRFGELRLAHGNLLARVAIVPESSPYDCLRFRGAYNLSGLGWPLKGHHDTGNRTQEVG